MLRRNLNLLLAVALVSLLCYQKTAKTQRSPSRATVEALVEGIDRIDRTYLEQIDQDKLLRGAMDGLMGQLDEYSAYIDQRNLTRLEEELKQEFGGIGIQIVRDPETKRILVMSPLVGSPAYKAGIESGDAIVTIEGLDTTDWKLDDVADKLKGPAGDTVRLAVAREGHEQPIPFELTRATIQTDSVLGDTRNPDHSWNFLLEGHDRIGYVRIISFSEHTASELSHALEWLKQHHAQALILDLRNNPGGLLSAAVEVCNMFIKQGRIVSIRGRGGKTLEDHDADGSAPYTDIPLAVLTNRYSASASEIVAACLADHARALIIGNRTWGKGSVQNVGKLGGGRSGALKLTTASYWRPSGKNIHRTSEAKDSDEWGVSPTPGFDVPLSDDELQKLVQARQRRDAIPPRTPREHTESPPSGSPPAAQSPTVTDPQLQKAVEYLEGKLSGPVAA